MLSITKRAALEHEGFVIVRRVFDAIEIGAWLARIDEELGIEGSNRRSLLRDSAIVRETASSSELLQLASDVLGRPAFPVRALLLDKTPHANWAVAWHQDLAIAITAHQPGIAGFTGWSEKDGIPHVIAPAGVLDSMATLRLHLDDCPSHNGPLRVIRGSHRQGVLDDAAIERWKAEGEIVTCSANRGDVLVIKPLLLHASSRAASPARRRVLHLEYAAHDLPHGLQWHTKSMSPAPQLAPS